VAGNLDNVFRGVGSRRGEKRDDDVIDGVAGRVGQLAQRRGPGGPNVFTREAQDFFGDRARVRAGDANDAESSAAGRCGDGSDGVAEVQKF
jgi:hypothetical protein